jgi:hypothetical protein
MAAAAGPATRLQLTSQKVADPPMRGRRAGKTPASYKHIASKGISMQICRVSTSSAHPGRPPAARVAGHRSDEMREETTRGRERVRKDYVKQSPSRSLIV